MHLSYLDMIIPHADIGARYVINCEITFWTSTCLEAQNRFVSLLEQKQIKGDFRSNSIPVEVVPRLSLST